MMQLLVLSKILVLNNFVFFSEHLEPLELVLRSTDAEGIFYCNGQIDFKKRRSKLTASIDYPISTSPKFQLKTEEMNSTTIRIRIKPNGFIGVNRISCHWNDNLTYGQAADLIIGGIEIMKRKFLTKSYFHFIGNKPNS